MVVDNLVDNARAAFEKQFGRAPTKVAIAPGRINLIGEHTDYNDGFALPMAIDRWIIAAGDFAGSPRTTVALPDIGRLVSFDDFHPDSPQAIGSNDPLRDARAIIGIFRHFRNLDDRTPALDLLVTGNLPIGAGLSSSAAVEVAVATLLNDILQTHAAATGIAHLCRHSEHEWLGTPCGILDMFAITHAEAGCAMLLDCRDESCRQIRLPAAEDCTFLVIDTGVRHDLAGGEYAERRETCAAAAKELGVRSLRDLELSAVNDPRLSDIQRKRVRHVVEENRRTLDAAAALESNPPQLMEFGELLFASHDSLRDLYEVSCDELDCVVETARALRENDPVFGARMTGGGFGGSAIVACPHRSIDQVRMTIESLFEKQFNRAPAVFEVNAVGAARMVTQ